MKTDREKRCVHKFKYRAGFKDDHHLKPRSRGGSSLGSNLLSLDAYKHDAWHLLFKNLTLDETIALLQRLKRIKQNLKLKR